MAEKKGGANSGKQKVKFATFNPQISKFLVKFGHHIKPKVVKTFAENIYQSDTPAPAKFS